MDDVTIYKENMGLFESYQHYWDTNGDERLKEWFIMSSPLLTICIVIVYALGVLQVGPKYMEKRRARKVKNCFIGYYLMQIVINAYLLYQLCSSGWLTNYSWTCQPADYSNSEQSIQMLNVCYLFFVFKFFDMFDTVLLVLGKRSDEVSVLHVVHHGALPLFAWFALKFVASGSGTFFVVAHTAGALLVRTAEFVASVRPDYAAHQAWEDNITRLRLAQFVSVGLHAMFTLYSGCDFPSAYCYAAVAYAALFFHFFFEASVRRYDEKVKRETGYDANAPVKPTEAERRKEAEKKKKPFWMKNPLEGICFLDHSALFDDETKES